MICSVHGHCEKCEEAWCQCSCHHLCAQCMWAETSDEVANEENEELMMMNLVDEIEKNKLIHRPILEREK